MCTTKLILYLKKPYSDMNTNHYLSNIGLLFTISLLVLLVSCSSVNFDSEADNSFLTDKPCPAPCWYHLELGISTQKDVLHTVENLPFVDNRSIKKYSGRWLNDDSAKSIDFGCIHPMKQGCGSIIISGDRMCSVWLLVNFPLTTEMIVDKLGIPDYLDYGGYHPEAGGCVVDFNWPNKGITGSIIDVKRDTLCRKIQETGTIPPKIQITDISYNEKNNFNSEPPAGRIRIQWPGFSQ